MPAILAEMDGNAIRAPEFRLHRRPDRIRLRPPASLPQRGNVIDIDAQRNHPARLYERQRVGESQGRN
jgi:hypothetical protein